MNKKNFNNEIKSEFNQYMISPIEDEAPNTTQTLGGIVLGIGYIFSLISLIILFIMSLFNRSILDKGYDAIFEESLAQVISGVIVVVVTGFAIGKRKTLKIAKGFNLKNLGIAATFVAIAFAANIICGYIETWIFGANDVTSSNQESVENLIFNYKLLGFIMVAIMAPFVEEIIFRYFVFRGSQKAFNTVWAFVITVLSFAGVHYLSSIMDGTLVEDLKSVLSYLVPSFLMTFLYYKNKNLATPIMFHMMYNGIQFILMVAMEVSLNADNVPSISGVAQMIINLFN